MTDKSSAAIREFAEKWCLRVIECMKDDDYIMHDPEGLLSDLTALISEHYTANEKVNQEVERRIAERMPSDELIEEIQEKSLLEYENAPICEIDYYSGFEDGVKWLRSRLTNQKTEGGGE